MPKWDTEEGPEENITKRDIKEAQGLTGELLWVSLRSRPDIAFAVSQMGQQVTKRPKWAVQVGKHVLGFLFSTADYCLNYGSKVGGHGFDDSLKIPRHERLIEAYSDISFAPAGNRSCQGVMVLFAGAPIQWEANRQAFCTLSTAESELMAAIEAMTMTQSVEALLSVIYRDQKFEKVLYCDNSSAISILQNPDGSWRTRHLRLRANCLRERLRHDEEHWKLRHLRGTLLVADLLTKAVTQPGSWRRFWKFLDFWSSKMDTWDETMGSEKKLKSPSDSERITQMTKLKGMGEKVAKMGCVVGLLQKIPLGSFGGVWSVELRNVLILVFTILIAVLTWKCSQCIEQQQLVCTDQRTDSSDLNKEEEKSRKANEQKESQEAREDEPAQRNRKGSRRDDEPRRCGNESLRENEPKLYKCQRSVDVEKLPPLRTSPKKVGKGVNLGDFWEPQCWSRGRSVEGEPSICGRQTDENKRDPNLNDRGSYFHHCPTGCPKNPPEKFRAGAMVPEEGNMVKMAMLRGPSQGGSEQGQLPWNAMEFLGPPRVKKDAWVQHWLDRGWLIRSHGSSRLRRFQPIHKTVPVNPKTMTGRRVTIGWEDANPVGTSYMVEDMWTDPPRNHYPYEKSWKGWTFLEVRSGEQGQGSYLGGGPVEFQDQGVPLQQFGRPKEDEKRQDPIGKQMKQSMGDFTPIHKEGSPWSKAEGEKWELPEVTVVTKVKFPGRKGHVQGGETNPMKHDGPGGSRSSGQVPQEKFEDDSEWEEVSEPAEGSGFWIFSYQDHSKSEGECG